MVGELRGLPAAGCTSVTATDLAILEQDAKLGPQHIRPLWMGSEDPICQIQRSASLPVRDEGGELRNVAIHDVPDGLWWSCFATASNRTQPRMITAWETDDTSTIKVCLE